MGFEFEREDSLVEYINPSPNNIDNMPNSHSNSFNGSYPTAIEDKARLEEIENQSKLEENGNGQNSNGNGDDGNGIGNGNSVPTHILTGTSDFALPNAFFQGTAPPLTARPYQLSKGYSHLVESPDKYKQVIIDKLGNLQSTLGQLGSDDLRQAKADIVYLRSILEDEGQDVAQIKAGANWASRDA